MRALEYGQLWQGEDFPRSLRCFQRARGSRVSLGETDAAAGRLRGPDFGLPWVLLGGMQRAVEERCSSHMTLSVLRPDCCRGPFLCRGCKCRRRLYGRRKSIQKCSCMRFCILSSAPSVFSCHASPRYGRWDRRSRTAAGLQELSHPKSCQPLQESDCSRPDNAEDRRGVAVLAFLVGSGSGKSRMTISCMPSLP